MEKYVSIIGAGAWGTAIAHTLAKNGHWVCLYTGEEAVAADINQSHCNTTYLPDVELPPSVWATTSPTVAATAEIIFVALPVPFLRAGLQLFAGLINPDHTIVNLSKGLEVPNGQLPLEIVGEVLGMCRTAVVSGPNFAFDLTKGKVMGTVVASRVPETAERISALFNGSSVRITCSDDVRGVQLCGALKNVLALQNGIVTGQGAVDNTRAYLLAMGLMDMVTVVQSYGGRRTTVYGLAGVGDVVLSGWCEQGRNYKLGLMLGQGVPLKEALTSFATTPEGLNTVKALATLITQRELIVPTLSGTCEAIQELELVQD